MQEKSINVDIYVVLYCMMQTPGYNINVFSHPGPSTSILLSATSGMQMARHALIQQLMQKTASL